ncbi:MAG: GNAT family N-acetyltransferase [Flavobacteriaceae bacterium]|nr:GNAT family N-acetyltransferase [Flavobacteriaceae bacterium]
MLVNVKKIDNKNDFETHLDLRRQIFQVEMGFAASEEHDKYDKARLCQWFLASADGVPVGAARWRENKMGYKLERICVLSGYRGQAIGQALLSYMLENMPKNQKINLGAPFELVPFCQKNGFKIKGEAYWEFGVRHRFMSYIGTVK